MSSVDTVYYCVVRPGRSKLCANTGDEIARITQGAGHRGEFTREQQKELKQMNERY
jgi:hypothetical protein